jgi:hypothetical protein
MTPRPGLRFAVAPHFHLAADWPRRLLVGGGPWRPPGDDELARLVAAGDESEAAVRLFGLPAHLGAAWWRLIERAATSGEGGLPGFEGFVARLAEFLAFKEMPLPVGARCDVVVTPPGERQAEAPRGLWGGINLGDEGTSVVLRNLSCGDSAAPIRLLLGPGEGFHLPRDCVVLGGGTEGKQGPDVLLLIAEAGSPAAEVVSG